MELQFFWLYTAVFLYIVSGAGYTGNRKTVVAKWYSFITVTAEKQAALAADYARLLTEIDAVAADCFLVVLDEGADAFAGDLLPRQAVLDFLQRHGKDREIILTGHSLPADLAPLCDYVTRMTKERHPFDTGAPARRGIEY